MEQHTRMEPPKLDYNKVTNRPIGCIYCGATVIGRVQQTPQGDKVKWICDRCNQLVRVGNV